MAQAATTGPQLALGEPLADALAAYRAYGLNILSTTGLVSRRLRVATLPEPDAALVEQVTSLLKPHGLLLKPLQADSWYVVRDPRTTAQQVPVVEPPAPEQLKPVVEEVVVTASHRLSNVDRPSERLGAARLNVLPTAGRDRLRALASLPGVSSSGVSARPRLRGGDANEVLFLLDGVPLLQPFHLDAFHGLFSTVNADLVSELEIFSAGFPVRYGGKLSGVVAVDLLEPVAAFEGGVDLNTVTGSIYGAGRQDRWSWIVSARHSTVQLLLRELEKDYGEPDFSDQLVRGTWDGERQSWQIGYFQAADEVSLSDDRENEQGRSELNYRALWVRGDLALSSRIFTDVLAYTLQAESELEGALTDPLDAVGAMNRDQDYEVFRFANRWRWLFAPRQELSFGWMAEQQSADYRVAIDTVYGSLGQALQGVPGFSRSLTADRSGTLISGFLSLESQLSDRLDLRLGLRYDLQDNDPVHDRQFSPRLELAFQGGANWQVLLDVGRYVQHQNLFELQVDDGLLELQDPQYSDQMSLSVLYQSSSGATWRADAYWHAIRDPWMRFDNLYNPWVLLPEIHSDRASIHPRSARARGLELSVSGRPAAPWQWSLSYALSDVAERAGGRSYARPWDQRHAVKGTLSRVVGDWSLGLSAAYRSGWPVTLRVSDPAQLPLLRYDSRLPEYLSVDLHIGRALRIGRLTGELYLDVTNLTDRVNVGGYLYEQRQSGIEPRGQKLLPLFPTLGLRFSW